MIPAEVSRTVGKIGSLGRREHSDKEWLSVSHIRGAELARSVPGTYVRQHTPSLRPVLSGFTKKKLKEKEIKQKKKKNCTLVPILQSGSLQRSYVDRLWIYKIGCVEFTCNLS